MAGWSRDGEDVEVYVSRGTETEVRVYEGEVESLSSATSAGAGIRVVSGGRQGFAYAGAAGRGGPRRDPATKPVTTPRFRAPSPGWGCPSRTAPRLRHSTSGATSWRRARPPRKVNAALDLEREVRAGDPRIRQVESANWGDASTEMALASSLGVVASDRSTACYLSAVAVAGEGAESQVALRLHRRPVPRPSSLPSKAAGRCRHPGGAAAGGDQAPLRPPPGRLRAACQRAAAQPARLGAER